MDLIKSLWRGDVRLVTTYWLYGALGSFLIKFPLIVLEELPLPPSALTTDFLALYTSFVLLYWGFMCVAIWRSSFKYKGSIWWAGLARLVVVLGVIKMVVELANLTKGN